MREIRQVEHIVNAKIRANIPLKEYRNIPIEEAKELGAIALFGEKYGDHVRVIQFGSSIEFCGGTHVAATGNIGMMKIVSESSVAAGVRRIEAYTGARVEEMLDTFQDTMRDLKALFNNAPDLSGAIRKYIEENAGLKKQVEDFMKEKKSATEGKTSAKYSGNKRCESYQVLCSHDTRRRNQRISLSSSAEKSQKTSSSLQEQYSKENRC